MLRASGIRWGRAVQPILSTAARSPIMGIPIPIPIIGILMDPIPAIPAARLRRRRRFHHSWPCLRMPWEHMAFLQLVTKKERERESEGGREGGREGREREREGGEVSICRPTALTSSARVRALHCCLTEATNGCKLAHKFGASLRNRVPGHGSPQWERRHG